MTNPYIRSLSPWRTLQRMTQTGLGILLLTSLSAGGLQAAIAQPVASSKSPAKSSVDSKTSSLADGTYLYGESPKAEQIGSAYMVFQVTQGNVVGAFYMPRSSFDCFSGRFEPGKLALNVIDTYEQATHPYAIALEQNSTVASNSTQPTVSEIGLQGFQRLAKVSANDQRILSMCQTNFQKNQAK
ncbi:MAG: hypothetical protein KME12_11745 [Trichocoleus desertorum ATA4-8-CV12]|nr:hypothetical protein [Trichocoleus desertorum ATA4-8-CV12]